MIIALIIVGSIVYSLDKKASKDTMKAMSPYVQYEPVGESGGTGYIQLIEEIVTGTWNALTNFFKMFT